MKMKFIPKYVSPSGMVIEFFPVDNVPGFTHRVVINGMSKDWLSGRNKPSAKVAAFFCEKHSGKKACGEGPCTIDSAAETECVGTSQTKDKGDEVRSYEAVR